MIVCLYDPQPAPEPGEVYVVKEVTNLYIVLEKVTLSSGVEVNTDALRQYMEINGGKDSQ